MQLKKITDLTPIARFKDHLTMLQQCMEEFAESGFKGSSERSDEQWIMEEHELLFTEINKGKNQ